MAQTIVAIVILGFITLLSFGLIGVGIHFYRECAYNRSERGLGVGIIALSCFSIVLLTIELIQLISTLGETTVTVLSKGSFESIVYEQNFNGEKIDSSKTYYVVLENGDKIIISEEEWKNIKDEYTYVPAKAEYIEED